MNAKKLASLLLIYLYMLTSSALADEQLLDDSRALARSFGQKLQNELQQALAEGGPTAALTVCKDRAPLIAAELSRQSGAKVARTSRRFRNPASSPEPWQIAVLEAFESEMRDENALPEHFQSTEERARYMKAIRIRPPCLACHGSTIPEEVRTSLNEAYPHDRATDYALNDLRGAFSITWPAPETTVLAAGDEGDTHTESGQ